MRHTYQSSVIGGAGKVCYNEAHAGIQEADITLQKIYEDFRKDIHMKNML